jgi:hypothetical protein
MFYQHLKSKNNKRDNHLKLKSQTLKFQMYSKLILYGNQEDSLIVSCTNLVLKTT